MPSVLIAEDSQVIQKILRELLARDSSIEIVAATLDGTSTVEQVRSRRPDVVLMDYRMPKMNAPDMIKAIMSETPVPILILTGAEPTGPKKQECLELGALGFLEKPKGMDYSGLSIQLIAQIKSLARLKPSKRSY